MKALSVRAPWWWLILHGGKDIENRDWITRFRGPVWIHASKWYVHQEVVEDICFARRINRSLAETPTAHPYEWLKAHCGCIVGSVEIVDCVTESDSPWFAGKYGFVLRNPVPLATPVLFKGALGFFDVPEGLIGDAA